MVRTRLFGVLVVVGFLGSLVTGGAPAAGGPPVPSTTPADSLVEWTTRAQVAIVDEAGYSPPEAAVLMGIVHAAIYDAVVAVEGGGRPYAVKRKNADGALAEAAVATAVHGVLAGLVPDQQPSVGAGYDMYLATLPGGQATAVGIAVGEEVAQAILALRAGDGRDDDVPYVQAQPGPGVFEPTAPFPPVLTHLGGIEPLVLSHADMFRPHGPPALTSDRYAVDLGEVATRGRLGVPRSSSEIATLRLWADHGVPQWNRVLLRLVDERDLNLFDGARLMAMAHASGGDAMIACFKAKYDFRFWRPVHAIRRAGTDGNDATAPEPTWTSQIPTPNHPEYPAAHNCHSSAIAAAIGTFFGSDAVAVTVDSEATGQVRRFDRLSDVVADVIEARILGGVHFRFSAEDGTTLGSRVAHHVTGTSFTRTGAEVRTSP